MNTTKKHLLLEFEPYDFERYGIIKILDFDDKKIEDELEWIYLNEELKKVKVKINFIFE